MSNQRPVRMKSSSMTSHDKAMSINAYDLVEFLTQAVVAFEKRGEDDIAARFEIFRDYVKEDVIENKKQFTFNAGIPLGL